MAIEVIGTNLSNSACIWSYFFGSTHFTLLNFIHNELSYKIGQIVSDNCRYEWQCPLFCGSYSWDCLPTYIHISVIYLTTLSYIPHTHTCYFSTLLHIVLYYRNYLFLEELVSINII